MWLTKGSKQISLSHLYALISSRFDRSNPCCPLLSTPDLTKICESCILAKPARALSSFSFSSAFALSLRKRQLAETSCYCSRNASSFGEKLKELPVLCLGNTLKAFLLLAGISLIWVASSCFASGLERIKKPLQTWVGPNLFSKVEAWFWLAACQDED